MSSQSPIITAVIFQAYCCATSIWCHLQCYSIANSERVWQATINAFVLYHNLHTSTIFIDNPEKPLWAPYPPQCSVVNVGRLTLWSVDHAIYLRCRGSNFNLIGWVFPCRSNYSNSMKNINQFTHVTSVGIFDEWLITFLCPTIAPFPQDWMLGALIFKVHLSI